MVHHGYIRRHQRVISFIQQWLDLAIILSGFFAAYWIYHGGYENLPSPYLIAAVIAVTFYYLVSLNTGLYQSWRGDQLFRQLGRILQTWFITLMALLLLGWALKVSAYFSRATLALWFAFTPLLLILSRIVLRNILRHFRSRGFNSRQIAIAGSGPSATAFASELDSNPWMGYQLAGCYDEHTGGETQLTRTGDFAQLIRDVKNKQYDEVYIALPMSAEKTIVHLVSELADSSVPVHIIPDLFTFNLMNARMSRIGSIPTISVYDSPHDDFSGFVKRSEDVILSSLILLLISPLMLAIVLTIKLTSRGPVFFKQRRYGIGGEEITVWKFRSMTTCDDGDMIKQATKGDARITPLGTFLRRTSLDELPQFINVLQGRMSIVGPRPHAVAHNELYRKDIQGYMLRHLVKPGITGWAQVNGWRGETDTLEKMQKRVEFDLFYIRNWSLWLDLKIIFLTIFKGFINKNAY